MREVEVGTKRSTEYEEGEEQVTKVTKSDDDDMEVRLLLLERSCGGIIGKGGENITRLRTTYNVNVQMPSARTVDRPFSVWGTMENCLGVIKEVLAHANQVPYSTKQQCSIEANLLVQTGMIGSILGKGGERIKEIREATNAKIKIYEECLPGSNERVIAIGGDNDQQILIVMTTILNIIKEVPSKSRPRYYDPANPANQPSEMMSSSGGFAMQNMENSWQNGPPPLFLTLQTVTTITAPNEVCGAIIGKGGSRIREVRHNSGADIKFSESNKDSTEDRTITISGTQQQVQMAEQLITQYMQNL